MYSSEWRLGNEVPIESYLPRDVAMLLNFNTEEDLDSSPDANHNDIPHGQETSQDQFGGALSPLQGTSILHTPSADATPTSELSVDWPIFHRQEPPDAFRPAVMNPCPVVPAKDEVAEVPPKMLKFVMPSGPRQLGEGTEEENQGIVDALILDENSLLMQMTLLVAGFVVGPSGESIRSIISKSGATIYSYKECIEGKESRIFYIEGTSHQILHAMEIITGAIERYKELAEGNYNGFQVDKKQRIKGVDFYYQPPPRSAVPHAASLRIHKNSKNKAHNPHHYYKASSKHWPGY